MVQTSASLPIRSFAQLHRGETEGLCADTRSALATLLGWTKSFVMSAHPDLGRIGDVCPFTAQGARIDALRFGVSLAGAAEVSRMRAEMLQAFEVFQAIDHPKRMGVFRAVIVGFPNCRKPAGLAALEAVQRSLRRLSLRQGRMIGLFHDATLAEGLWNREFRPLRAPIPLLAIRELVENDAAFAVRNPLLVPTYLRRFKLKGGRRLVQLWLRAS